MCTAYYLCVRETETQVIKCLFILVCNCVKKLRKTREGANKSGDSGADGEQGMEAGVCVGIFTTYEYF